MKEAIGLIVCVIVYTVTIFWFGMWVQTKSDQRQLRAFEEAAFKDGCLKCAQFERLACDRNQLQGQEGVSQIP